ncbi:MAG TPA: hypothetical protein VFQ06_10165 [Nitrospira sp.]|nr:hypothetical protein [Nitrospira sp.]
MTTDNPAVRKRSKWWKVLRVLAIGLPFAIGVFAATHVAWKRAGSGQWVEKIDKDGIKVWSRKRPGETITDIKAVMRIRNTPTTAIAAFMNEGCDDFMEGCVSWMDFEPWSEKTLQSTGIGVVIYPFKLKPREFLLRTRVSQDPKTKAVLMHVTSHPDLLPRNKFCHRVEDVDNRWLFTPLGNGQTEVEFTMHMDEGMPYFLVNPMTPRVVHKLMADLPSHFDKPQYQNVKLAYIQQ